MDATYLRVSSDTHDPSLPHVNFRFIDCCNFQKIEGRRVQEKEGNEGEYPDKLVDTRDSSNLPQLHPVVSVVDEVDLHKMSNWRMSNCGLTM